MIIYRVFMFLATSYLSFVADLRDAIYGFHFTDRMLSQLPTLQAAQVAVTEPDNAVSAL